MWLLAVIILIGLGLYFGYHWLIGLGIVLLALPLIIFAIIVGITLLVVLGALFFYFKDK